jgi:hypothetical protein
MSTAKTIGGLGYQKILNDIVQAFNNNDHGRIYEPELKIANEK